MKRLLGPEINQVAQSVNVAAAALRAVIAVESSGSGFLQDGRAVILLERHILWQRLLLSGRDIDPKPLAQDHPELCGPTWNPRMWAYGTPEHQWDRFNDIQAWAAKRDPMRAQGYLKATCEACSWGLLQVLGMNFAACGFPDVLQFRAAMETDEKSQLSAALKFMESNGALACLRKLDWTGFARIWNGSGQVELYAGKLNAAYIKAGGK